MKQMMETSLHQAFDDNENGNQEEPDRLSDFEEESSEDGDHYESGEEYDSEEERAPK